MVVFDVLEDGGHTRIQRGLRETICRLNHCGVTEAQATGAIDPSLDKEAVVRFCHALGFGFLLFRAIELDLPDPEPWQRLISHLVDALDVRPHRSLTPTTDQGEPRE